MRLLIKNVKLLLNSNRGFYFDPKFVPLIILVFFDQKMDKQTSQKSALLYTRVSTEEQAVRGGSLKTQEQLLRQYCFLNNIRIERVFTEDYSAKTFDRPEWRKLLKWADSLRNPPELLLFTRWDRFSRNAGDAYSAIRSLNKLGVNPQAIEQPLDTSIPENKLMLSFYLAIPEVENDRRALNTKVGIQKARENGRVVGHAPIGYINYCYPNGLKSVVIKQPEASIIERAFEQLSKSKCKIRDAYSVAKKAGIKCCYSNFWKLLQNPVYAGNIKITDDRTQTSYIVPGLHQGIISVDTFEKVQSLFFGRKKSRLDVDKVNFRFPLRGFIACPKCNKLMTGSSSFGRAKKYDYYHCGSRCTFRIRTNKYHELLSKKLEGLTPQKKYTDLYSKIVAKGFADESHRLLTKKNKTINSIEALTDRINKAKSLLLDSYIGYEEYDNIKCDLEGKIELLGKTVDLYSKMQIDLTDKIKSISECFPEPQKLLSSLEGSKKSLFLSRILLRGHVWDPENLDNIFENSFRMIYGLSDITAKLNDTDNLEIQATLQTISNLHLLSA